VAATNLAFRDLYEQALAASETGKLLVVDRAPPGPSTAMPGKAPPPFYPDLLAQTPPEARITLNLQSFLVAATGDPTWPRQMNEPRYAGLISRHLDAVLRAHQNLRAASPDRFTDHDLQVIVAYAALGIPEAAFKSQCTREGTLCPL
jgi:hypothetical protein